MQAWLMLGVWWDRLRHVCFLSPLHGFPHRRMIRCQKVPARTRLRTQPYMAAPDDDNHEDSDDDDDDDDDDDKDSSDGSDSGDDDDDGDESPKKEKKQKRAAAKKEAQAKKLKKTPVYFAGSVTVVAWVG